MKVLIRDVKTGLYLSGNENEKWVKTADMARDFYRGADAIDFAKLNQLSGVEVVHVFPDPEFNIATRMLDFSAVKS